MSFARPPYGRGASKASSTTQCQKCLQRGHYSYECKSAPQERPYISRPSRSAQLLNPRLRAALTHSAPPPVEFSKDALAKSMADEDAGKSRDREGGSRKRHRSQSVSSQSSVDSVSTVSTNASRKRSRSRGDMDGVRERKVRRRSSSPRPRGRRGSNEERTSGRMREERAGNGRAEGEARLREDAPRQHGPSRGDQEGSQEDRDYRGSKARSPSPYSRRIGLTRAAG